MKQSQSAVTEKKFDDRYSGKSWINKTEGIHYPERYNSKFTHTVLEKCLWTVAFVWSKYTLNTGGVGGAGVG